MLNAENDAGGDNLGVVNVGDYFNTESNEAI